MKQNKIYIYEYIGTEPLEHSLQMLVSKKAQLNAIWGGVTTCVQCACASNSMRANKQQPKLQF